MATYSIHEVDKYLAVLAATSREATLRGLHSAALRMQQHIVTEVIPSITPEPTARGAYKAAWKVNKLPNGAEVVNTLFIATLIEYGVRAENVKISRKMIEALTDWVHMKAIGAVVSTTKSGRVKVVKPSKDEQTSIAWAIAKNLQKHGIFNRGKGWSVLGTANKRAKQFIKEEVSKQLRKEFA